MECHPDNRDWLPDCLGDRFVSMAWRLRQGIDERSIRQYFYTSINLLEGKNEDELVVAARKIDDFLHFPGKYFNLWEEESAN